MLTPGGSDLSAGLGPAIGARVAAVDAEQVTVAWSVGQGASEGVYIRQRNNFLWDSAPTRLPGETGSAPRDVYLSYDDQARVQIVWTGLQGGHRRVFHATMQNSQFTLPPRALNPDDDADADFPLVICMRGQTIFVVWQSSHLTHFTIESVPLDMGGRAPLRLPSLSGESLSAMSPQVIQSDPLMVGYDEVLESGSELRFSTFSFVSRRWERIELDGLGVLLPSRNHPLVQRVGAGLPFACWTGEASAAQGGGNSAINVARRPAADAPDLSIRSLDHPSGDMSHPQFVVGTEDHVTLVWQVFAAGVQSVVISSMDWGQAAPPNSLAVSPEGHRFASDPWHCSRGRWSMAVWTDDHRDGGTGEIGFAEVQWPDSGVGSAP